MNKQASSFAGGGGGGARLALKEGSSLQQCQYTKSNHKNTPSPPLPKNLSSVCVCLCDENTTVGYVGVCVPDGFPCVQEVSCCYTDGSRVNCHHGSRPHITSAVRKNKLKGDTGRPPSTSKLLLSATSQFSRVTNAAKMSAQTCTAACLRYVIPTNFTKRA